MPYFYCCLDLFVGKHCASYCPDKLFSLNVENWELNKLVIAIVSKETASIGLNGFVMGCLSGSICVLKKIVRPNTPFSTNILCVG
jgi:hypothetical protein